MNLKLADDHAFLEKHEGALDVQSDVRLWLRLLSTTMVVEKRIRRRFAERFDTTLPRFDILAALDRADGGLTMTDLSRQLLVSNGNVTALVQTLIKEELVRVEPDARDKRVTRVTLLPKGGEQFAFLAAAHRKWIADMFAGVDGAAKAQLFDLLGTLKGSLAEEKNG